MYIPTVLPCPKTFGKSLRQGVFSGVFSQNRGIPRDTLCVGARDVPHTDTLDERYRIPEVERAHPPERHRNSGTRTRARTHILPVRAFRCARQESSLPRVVPRTFHIWKEGRGVPEPRSHSHTRPHPASGLLVYYSHLSFFFTPFRRVFIGKPTMYICPSVPFRCLPRVHSDYRIVS